MLYHWIPKRLRYPTEVITSHVFQLKNLAVLEACLIGLISGLAGVILKESSGWLGAWRVYAANVMPDWILLPMIGGSGGLITGWLITRFAPETAGSGIPHVKSALAGMGKPLNSKVAIAKLIATTLTVGSGFTLGRQGPTVQIGAALAAQLSRWFPTSPDYLRQLTACGAAAGLAAGFNAPLAGVLFVVEELLQDFSGLTLGAAIIAAFVGAVVSQTLSGDILNFNVREYNVSFVATEIPFYLILGILAGVLGVVFTKAILGLMEFNRRVLHFSLSVRMALGGLICGIVIAALNDNFHNYAGLRDIVLAGEASSGQITIAFIVYFVLTIISAASGAPGGIFAPSLVLGAALGYLVGLSQSLLLDISLPATYALTGMGAFFCAVSRAPITAVVIVFEIAREFRLVLPLMITCVVSYLVASLISKESLYNGLLRFNGIDLKAEKAPNDLLTGLIADQVMQRQVETLNSDLSLDEVVMAFARSHHRGFPVVEGGQLVGIITQTDLDRVRQLRLAGNTLLIDFMTTKLVTVRPTNKLSDVLYLLNRYKLSRLPVTEGMRLVGIITRSDIIKAESEQLTGDTEFITNTQPSYIVYQTRAPAVGKGRILVPLANQHTNLALLELASSIASQRNYELEFLQVIIISHRSSPSETAVDITASRMLLQEAEQIGQNLEIPVHTQIRVSHDLGSAILDTVKERHINLVLMGWKGETRTPGKIFGDVSDLIIQKATCDVILVKWGDSLKLSQKRASARLEDDHFSPLRTRLFKAKHSSSLQSLQRWLVPIRSCKKTAAVELLPALCAVSDHPEVQLCQVSTIAEKISEDELVMNQHNLEKVADFLEWRLKIPVMFTAVCAKSVVDALTDLADKKQCDVIVLGASKETLLQQAIKGNIPEAIVRNCKCTVMLVRSM